MDVPEQGASWELKLKLGNHSGLTETAKNNRETLLRAYEAQLAGDMESWWNLFDTEVVFSEAESLPYGCSVKGLEAAKAGVEGMFSAWSHLLVEIEEFVAAGDLVIAYLRMKATSRKTGQIYDAPVAEVFRFRNGKVIEWHPIYWDTHLVRKVCGVD